MRTLLSSTQIDTFLHLGYVPSPRWLDAERFCNRSGFAPILNADTRSFEDLVHVGVEVLRDLFCDLAATIRLRDVVVPISGGLDSRAVLAGLLAFLPRSTVRTVTIGVPGALDYELGQLVAASLGVQNVTVNLQGVDWSEAELLEIARRCRGPRPVLESYLFGQLFRPFGVTPLYVSGFLGDALSGAHLPPTPSRSWHDAKTAFVAKGARPGFQNPKAVAEAIPDRAYALPCTMSYDDQLDLFVRQRSYIAPLVLPGGYRHAAPFRQPGWMQFILQIPRGMREQQKLFKAVLQRAYPEAFALPTKKGHRRPLRSAMNAGLGAMWRGALDRSSSLARRVRKDADRSRLNYIDFASAYRSGGVLRNIAGNALEQLHRRGCVTSLDVRAVWQAHAERRINVPGLISSLVDLELFYRAKTNG